MSNSHQEDHERVTDESDRATQIEMETTQDAIEHNRRLCLPQQSPREDGTYAVTDCIGCGEEIGEERLRVAIKNLYCIVCIEKMERTKRFR